MTIQEMLDNINAFTNQLNKHNQDEPVNPDQLLDNIDRLIADMLIFRQQLLRLGKPSTPFQLSSIRQATFFGIWADHEEMEKLSSREWLTNIRTKQWGP